MHFLVVLDFCSKNKIKEGINTYFKQHWQVESTGECTNDTDTFERTKALHNKSPSFATNG